MDPTNNSRKRARDEIADDNAEILQAKKLDCLNPAPANSDVDDDEKPYEFRDGIRVFDFPWLKDDGVIFSSDSEPYFEDHEDRFAPNCSYLDDQVDSNSSQNLCISPNSDDGENDGDDLLSSLLVDDHDLDSVDCIWSCVIDHPLDLGFGKG